MAQEIKRSPLVIIGLDAADPRVIQRSVHEGYLPNIASMMRRGCWGRTGGQELVCEHGIWVSLFSGTSRSQHGYYYFRQLKPSTYDLELVAGPDVNAQPFWSYLLGTEAKVAIIDAPDTRPLPGLRGIQVANWGTHENWDADHYATAAKPPQLLKEIRKRFGPKLSTTEKNESSIDDDKRIYRELLRQVQKKGAMCRHLLGREHFDLVVMAFSESHTATHQFWKYSSEVHDSGPLEPSELAHAIRAVYEAIDHEIGLLLAQLPRDCNVFILSAVGMGDYYPTTGLAESFFRELGYQKSVRVDGRRRRPLALVRRALPESWRVALSRHLSRNMRERLLADQFRNNTDWRQTTAFAIPSSHMSFVRINLRGREPDGIVEPGGAYRKLLDRIEDDFRQLIDPETTEPAVVRVARTVDLFGCEPPLSLPDLFVEWKAGRYMQSVVHPKAVLRQQRPDWYRRSDHLPGGFIAFAGPSIVKRGDIGEVSVLDFAPTCIALMGREVPEELPGKSFLSMYPGAAGIGKQA